MFKMVIVGEKSKIGQSILAHSTRWLTILPEAALEVEKVDYLILASTKERNKAFIKKYSKSPEIKIFDFSGILKKHMMDGQHDIAYAFEPLFTKSLKLVAMPGCSSLAMLQCLFPIKDFISDEIIVDLKFPRSSLKYDSPNLIGLDQNIKGLMYGTHPHQAEVNFILKTDKITVIPSLVDVPSGISLNVYFPTKEPLIVKQQLENYYLSHKRVQISKRPVAIADVVKTGKTLIYIFPTKSGLVINAVTDNLINDRYMDFLDFVR